MQILYFVSFLCERRATPRPPLTLRSPQRELYLADDLLRAHSSEVSACRGRFNDVGGWLADSLRRLFRGPLLFEQWYGVLETESHFLFCTLWTLFINKCTDVRTFNPCLIYVT